MSDYDRTYAGSSLTVEDMWSVMNVEGNSNWGVVGYEAPKNYFDFKKKKGDRETWEMHKDVWEKKGHYPKPKLPVDANGKPIFPTKTNFIDECIKVANENFSKKKFDSYVEYLKDKKGKTLEEVEGIKKVEEVPINDKSKAKIYKHDRSTYIADIFKNEIKNSQYPPRIQELVEKIKERQGKYSSPSEKSKMKGKSSAE
jgi:hypothetical protein